MLTWLNKHFAVIALLLIVVLLAAAWFVPTTARVLSMVLLAFIFSVTTGMIVQRSREGYLQGKLSRPVFLRSVALEITGVLLAMLLAAWIGNQIASLATGQITDALMRFVAGVLVAFLAGIGIGIFVKKAWNHVLKPVQK